MRVGPVAGFVSRSREFREGAEDVGEVQQLPELAAGVVEVADHPVLAAAYLAVLLTQSGDASLYDFQDLQAGLGELAVQRGQPDRGVIETADRRQQSPYRLEFLHRVIERGFPLHVTPWSLRAATGRISP